MWKIFRPTDYKHTITTQAIQLIIVSTTNNNCAHVLIARLALLKVELWLIEGYRCPIREQKWPDFTTLFWPCWCWHGKDKALRFNRRL